MNDLIETAMDGALSEEDLLNYIIENGADEELLSELGYNNIIKSSIKTANIIDNIYNKCKGNEKLLIGVIALLLTTGQLFGYEVKRGDNLWNIAKKSDCSIEQIYRLNPELKNKKFIKPGMNIVIPNKIPPEPQIVFPGEKPIPPEPQIQFPNNDKLDMEAALKALREVESSNGANTKGDRGKAIGDYQLWPIFVEDYHRLGGNKNYKCHVVNGVAQKDDVRWDRKKSEEIIKYVFTKYGYKNMQQIIKGYKNKPGWNKGVSNAKLQEYINAYNKYKGV